MNVMEKARRSDALHYDWISRRNLCDMIANLESDLEDAKKENVNLRELVRKIYSGYLGGRYAYSCNGCKHAYEDYGGYEPLNPDYCVFDDSDEYVGCWKRKKLEAELRELGVEVES